jgi:hypothetical protein
MIIKSLEGTELSSVIFIRDYIQFVFEGEKENVILSSFILPSSVISNHTYTFQTPGWRDALCSFINKIVRSAFVAEENSIKLTFKDGSMLRVSLKDEDYDGPEAAMLFEGKGKITVW